VLGAWIVLAGLALAAVVFLVTGGHVVFLPLVLIFPLFGLWGRSRRRRR
jgi:hypothetical protein